MRGGFLESLVIHFQHVADGIDQEADHFIIGLNDDVHGFLVLWARWELHPVAEVNGGDNLPAQIDQASDFRGGQGHFGHILIS